MPARAAGLQRRPRHVDPDVAAARHRARRARGRSRRGRRRAGPTCGCAFISNRRWTRPLAVVVARVRLAGEQELHGPVGVAEQRERAVGVAQQQVQALVGRDAAGEADRQHVGVERADGGLARTRACRRAPGGRSRCARARARSASRRCSAAGGPQVLVGDRPARRPRWRARPRACIQPSPRWRSSSSRSGRADPGRDVHAVGDVGDRHVLDGAVGPQPLPHARGRPRRGGALTPLAVRDERSANWVTPNGSSPSSGWVRPAAHELVDVDAHLVGEPAQRARRPGRRDTCRCRPGPGCGW